MNTPSLGHSGLKMHPTCGVNTPCKQCGKYHAVEKGRRRNKEGEIKKKEEGRRKEEEDGTAAMVTEASLTGLGGQSLACCHLRSAS